MRSVTVGSCYSSAVPERRRVTSPKKSAKKAIKRVDPPAVRAAKRAAWNALKDDTPSDFRPFRSTGPAIVKPSVQASDAARALGRLGGLARKRKLTQAQRSESARVASEARWSKNQ